MSDLSKITPPKELSEAEYSAVFDHICRRLAGYRDLAEVYAQIEWGLSSFPEQTQTSTRDHFIEELDGWAQELLSNAWFACKEPGGGDVPTLDPLADTSTAGLDSLPPPEKLAPLFNAILFLHVTSGKAYSARTRAFLTSFTSLDESAVAATLKDPQRAVDEAEDKAKEAKAAEAAKRKTLRNIGIGLGAVAGGVLVGITGGLAAPLVGAGLASVLGWLGVGGTAAGLLASGLASSSVVCGALFGVYGSKRSAEVVERYTREVEDLAIVPVRQPKQTMAVRLCVSGWLDVPEDVVAPWTVFDGDDTFALQWEVQALRDLSNAFTALLTAQAMKYIKTEIIKRTVFASLWMALSPTAWLKLTQIIDNPWTSARSLAVKAGRVLGALIAQRVMGNRPITLVGYSLGSLVVFEALQYLASLPPSQTTHLIQDVFLFGAPIPINDGPWSAARRVVSGRLVNGYSENDYILAVLSRMSNISWGVAGMGPVPVKGVENIKFDRVDGHLKWRGLIGECLQECGASGIDSAEVEKQKEKKGMEIQERMDGAEAQQGSSPADDVVDVRTSS